MTTKVNKNTQGLNEGGKTVMNAMNNTQETKLNGGMEMEVREIVERLEGLYGELLNYGFKKEAKKLSVLVTDKNVEEVKGLIENAEKFLLGYKATTMRTNRKDGRVVKGIVEKQLRNLVKASMKNCTFEEMKESLLETASKGNQTVDGITAKEKEVLVGACYHAFENKKYNQCFFKDAKKLKLRNNFGGLKDQAVKGFRAEIISWADKHNFKINAPVCKNNTMDVFKELQRPTVVEQLKTLIIDDDDNIVQDGKALHISKLSKPQKTFINAVNSVLRDYSSKVVDTFIVNYRPQSMTFDEAKTAKKLETKFRLAIETTSCGIIKRWTLELPYIMTTGRYETVNSLYYCCYIPYNFEEYIVGKSDKMFFQHPITYLVRKALVKYSDGNAEPMTKDDLFDIIKVCDGGFSWSLQRRIKDILNNAKQNYNNDDFESPLYWVPKELSSLGIIGRKNVVYMSKNDYQTLVGIKDRHIEGLDYLTGSTSKPAERCCVTSGYMFHYVTEEDYYGLFEIIKRTESSVDGATGNIKTLVPTSHIQEYLSEINLIHVAGMKTSGKRNNGPTMSSTYNLVNPQRYKRHITNSLSALTQEKINTVLSTLFVAKINLPEDLSPELVKLGLYSNTNDCFLIDESLRERMKTYYSKAHKAVKEIGPSVGSKFYGVFRDKGSVSAVLRKYRAMVDFEVSTLLEAERLIEALKQMRGDNVFYKFDEERLMVSFYVDVIANPSTGRDNVGAILLQSELEKQAMLSGEHKSISPEEVGKMKVKEVVGKSKLSHRVYLVNRDGEEVFSFDKVALIMEDFFWQPQHDNRGYIREKDVSTFYNQGIAGFHTFTPELHKSILNSFRFDVLKQTMVALNYCFLPETNNKTSEGLRKEIKSSEEFMEDLGFEEETVKELAKPLVEEPKFEAMTGVLTQYDPYPCASKERVDEFIANNCKTKDDSYKWIEDEAYMLNNLFNGRSSKLVKDVIWNSKKQCKELSEFINVINSKYYFEFEIDGHVRVAFIPFDSDEKVEYFNKPEEEKELIPQEPLKGYDIDFDEEEGEGEEPVFDFESLPNQEELSLNNTIKYDWTEGPVAEYKHVALANLIWAYYNWKDLRDGEEKDKAKEVFLRKLEQFENQLTKIFSKEWKYLYSWKMEGLSGVILPCNNGIDGVELPLDYCKKHNLGIGDKVLAFRDPIQGLFLELEVRGYNKCNAIRIHSRVLTWIGGDHDGDKLQIVPIKTMLLNNAKFIKNEEALVKELDGMLPSHMLEDKFFEDILAEKDLNFSLDDGNYSNDLLSLLDESKKSSKFYDVVTVEQYIEEYQKTVLNMRTVKEGTAIAGAFANFLYEVAELVGLDLKYARVLGDRIQQLALDSKHTASGGFEVSMWCKVAQVLTDCKQYAWSVEKITREIEKALA